MDSSVASSAWFCQHLGFELLIARAIKQSISVPEATIDINPNPKEAILVRVRVLCLSFTPSYF